MAFNSSGVYSRVSNSFSDPVVGTTISPTDADTYFDDIDAALNAYYGTSTTSLAIGLGTKAFTTQTGKLFGAGRFVIARSDANAANYMFGQVTSYSSTTLTVNVLATGGSGTLADWTIYVSGARGGAGPVAGIKQTYSTTTTDSDPGAGIFRFNNATIASVTAAYFDNVDADGVTVSAVLDTWDDSTTTTKGSLRIEKQDDSSVWAVFTVTGSVTDGTGYRKLTLTYVAHGGTWTNGDTFRIDFSRSGDKGSDGAGAGDVTAASNFGTDNVLIRSDGTGKGVQSSVINLDDTTGTIYPTTNDSGALGKSAQSWADLFLASGGVINFNAGDVTVTHSANTLAFGGASSGYTFDAAALPSANDSAALGAAATSWADLFLASGAVINYANGNYTVTHSSGALTLSGTLSLGTSNAFTCGTIELGAASDTTISRSSAGVIAVEGVDLTANIVQNSQSTAYTCVLSDANKHILHPAADNNARTFTIPSSSVAYPIGTTLTFINEINTVTISITSDTLTLAGAGSTGSRTLAANGMATAIKIASTKWMISGTGLT